MKEIEIFLQMGARKPSEGEPPSQQVDGEYANKSRLRASNGRKAFPIPAAGAAHEVKEERHGSIVV